jgi:hypothetical protein
MLGVPLDKRVRRVLGVSIGDDLALTLDDTATAYFPAHVLAPQADNGLLDSSPRTALSPWRVYWLRAPAELRFGDHIEVPDDTTYELISKPRAVNNGRRVVGHSAPALPVGVLYPRSAEVWELGGEKALSTIACNVYSQREDQQPRGDFHDTFGEAPASALEDLTGTNRELRIGEQTWKIVDAALSVEAPYVSLNLRKAG